MALLNEIVRQAKQQKATTTTKVNKAAPTGGLANKVKTSVPKTVAPVAPTPNVSPKTNGVTNVLNKVKENKPLANAQNGVSNIAEIVKSIDQQKVTQDRSKKAGTGILTANSRSAVEEKKNNIFATLRPKEEFDQEYNSINKQLNDIYRARSLGAVVNYDTTKLENRKAELDEERKLQNERAEKYTIPEFEKKYAEAMSNGNIDTALDYAGILETYDDRDFLNTTVKADLERLDADEKKIVHDLTERQASYEEIEHHLNNRGYDYDRAKDILNSLNKNALERFLGTGFNAAVHGFNSMTIGFYDTFLKDTVPELAKDLYNKKAEIARFSGNEELAKQYESGAEVAQKYADSFDATDPNNAAMVIKNGTERAMQLDSYAQSPTMKLALEVDQSIANMTPHIVTGTGLYGMGAQVYADTFYNDRAEGYDIQTSALHSALSAANEVAWENVWKVLPVDENALGQQIAKVFDSDIGKAAMVEMASPSSEFVEEFGTSITGHYIDNWILKKNDPLNLEDAVKDGMMGYVQAALMRLPVDVAKTTMNEITTTRRANYEKSIIERTNEIASMPENQNNETVQDLARFINVVGQARLEDFYQKSILSRAITVESDEVSVPSSKELLGMFEQGMIPAEDNYQREVQKNALELATASQKMLDDAGIKTDLFEYMSTDSDTRRELSRLAAEGLVINGTEYIQNKNADYRNAMIEIAENNIKGEDGSSAMKTADWLSMDDAQREEARIAAKTISKDSSIDAFSMARLEPGVDGYLKTKNDLTQLVASTDQGIVLSMDKVADYDSNKFWGIIDGIAKDIGTKEEYTEEEEREIKRRLTPVFMESGQKATIVSTVVHEVTHFIEQSKDNWNALKNQIKAEMGEERYNEALKRLDTVYKLLGVNDANAESELVAHYIQENIANLGFLARISKYNNSAFYRLYRNLKSALPGNSKTVMENTFMDALRDANRKSAELGVQYSAGLESAEAQDTIENKIYNSMSMSEARRMLEKTWNQYKDDYDEKTLDEFLKNDPDFAAEQMELLIENTFNLQDDYVNSNEDILNGEYSISDIVKAYLDGKLKNENKSFKLKDIEFADGAKQEDTFFTPKDISNPKDLLEIANQRMTKSNEADVLKARADLITYAHNPNALNELGMTNAELNKKIRSWSRYSAQARATSEALNRNVPEQYRWSGLENSNNLNKYLLSNDANKETMLKTLVKSISGKFDSWSANDLVNTMLSIDSHINYKDLSIVFDGNDPSLFTKGKRSANGTYNSRETRIAIGRSGLGTLSHETGHFIDNLWGRELSNLTDSPLNMYLSEISTERLKTGNASADAFIDNFKNFIDKLSAKSDIRSDYTQRRTEVFARFVDHFTAWVNKTAGGYGDQSSWYKDNFNTQDCYDFVKLLQQKSMLNATVLNESQSKQFSVGVTPQMETDSKGRKLSNQQREFFKESKVTDDNGNLLEMYHGTPYSDITAFKKGKAGYLGPGIYLTSDKAIAKRYASQMGDDGNIHSLYANVTNPFVVTTDNPAKEILGDRVYNNRANKQGSMYSLITNADINKLKRMGYDGIVWKYAGSVEVNAFASEQIKRVDNLNPTSNKDIRYSAGVTPQMETEYDTAVENNDMETAQRLVDEVATNSGAYKGKNGMAREFYHGTNNDDFTEFDPSYIASASGDTGYFGKGFYFAFDEREARYYGKNVIKAYLNINNPFNYIKEFATYKGKRTNDYNAGFAVEYLNLADKFPSIAEKEKIRVARKGSDEYEYISAKQFAEEYKNVIENKKFEVQEMDGDYGKEYWTFADRESIPYEVDGKTMYYDDWGYQKRYLDEKDANDQLLNAYYYLAENVYDDIDLHNFTYVILENNDEFTDELKKRGYDGVIQSEEGDEIVAFTSEQIKNSDPVTYDDDGNVIPLSERFDYSKKDRRYSMGISNNLKDYKTVGDMPNQVQERLFSDYHIDYPSVSRQSFKDIKTNKLDEYYKKTASRLLFDYNRDEGRSWYEPRNDSDDSYEVKPLQYSVGLKMNDTVGDLPAEAREKLWSDFHIDYRNVPYEKFKSMRIKQLDSYYQGVAKDLYNEYREDDSYEVRPWQYSMGIEQNDTYTAEDALNSLDRDGEVYLGSYGHIETKNDGTYNLFKNGYGDITLSREQTEEFIRKAVDRINADEEETRVTRTSPLTKAENARIAEIDAEIKRIRAEGQADAKQFKENKYKGMDSYAERQHERGLKEAELTREKDRIIRKEPERSSSNSSSKGLKPEQTVRLKSGKIPAKVSKIIQKAYDAFDEGYSNDMEQFGVAYEDVADEFLEAANEVATNGEISKETMDRLRDILYYGVENVYEPGERGKDVYEQIKDILKTHPLSNSAIGQKYVDYGADGKKHMTRLHKGMTQGTLNDMRRNGIRFKNGGYDLGELESVFKEAGLGQYFDERTFSDLEDFNKTLSDLQLTLQNQTHKSYDMAEFAEETEESFNQFFDETMKQFVEDVSGKQMSDQAAEVIDSLDVSDEEFNKFVKRDPISPRALENINKHKKELVDTAPEWIPNYDIIREKHPEFTDLEMNDALFEILSEGTISESTAWRIKEDMLRRNSVQTNNEADQSIKELVDDSLDYFAADAAYKMNKKAMNSVANKANTIIRSFTGQNVTEGALDSYEQMEGLEKTLKQVEKRRGEVSAKNETMVKELLAAGADYGSSWMTLEQNLDKIAGTDSNLRQTLRDYFELPKYESQIKYVQFLQKYGDTLQGLVKDGIRAGTKESAAVQYMLEGHTEDGAKYGQKELMEQFPKTWEKLDKAAKTLRNMYDEMYNLIETNRENTYGDIDAKYDLQLAKAREKANTARRTADQIKQKLGEKADARLEAMYNRADAQASKLERQYEQMLEDKATRDGTRRQKLQYRKNYAHHLTDQGGFFKQMKNALSDGSSVPTKLSGISNRAKPLSGFASFFQRQNAQTGYVADAIGGMAEYIKDASKIYAYDPYIEYLRFAASDIRAEASGNEMSRFVSWVDNYANGIAGKTQMLDRGIRETFGEKPLKVIKTLNNQARKNAIVGNLSTALVQFANLPNAIGVLSQYGGAESALDIARGLSAYASTLGREGAESVSPFMSARYYDINTMKGNVAQRSLNGIAKTLLEFGDHEAAKMIWNCSYQQALRLNVDDPVMYADDLTRRSVAGRSVSELPLAMESQVLKLLMPFQVETNNTFHLMTGLMRDKKLGSLLAMLIGGWLMNGLYEAVIGRRPITDPIDAILDAKDSENPADVATRLGGELLSAIPGSSYAVSLFGLNDNQRKKLFGENDPSRYGTGNIGLSTIGSAIMDTYNAFDKKDPRYAMNAVSDLASTYLAPGGGRQIQRSIEGLQSEGILPQYVSEYEDGKAVGGEFVNEPRYYTPSSKVGFVNDPNDIFDVITAGTFGRWATKAGKEYLENGGKYLSDQATRQLEALGGDSEAYNAVIAMRDMQGIPGVDNSKALQKRKYLEDQGLWDTFAENMDGEWSDYGLNKTVGNASEDEFNKLYSEVFGEGMRLDVASAAGMKETLDTETPKEEKSSKTDANLDFLAGTPYEKAAIQNLDMDEDVLQTVTDLGYDYQTIKQIDDYIDNTDSLRKEDGSAIRNTKALQMRQYYEEMGVYDDIFQYISENGLDPQDYGLNKTVMGYSDSKFESQYSKYYGGSSSGSSGSSSSGSSKSSSSSRKSSKRKSSKKKGFSSEEEMKAFFDQLVANIGLSSSKSSSTINNILKKSKNLRNTKFSKRSS